MLTTEREHLDRTLALLDRLVSPTTGVLKRALLLPFIGGQLRYSHFIAAPASYAVLPTGGDIANPGASAWDPRRSIAQVAFEAIERYCAAFVDYTLLLRSDVESDAFETGIQRFAPEQYGAEGFPYVPSADDATIHWAVGRSLLTGSRRYVPASFTFLPYRPVSQAESLGPSFSTGMSAAWELEDACLSGLLEVVERDAFAITWMNRLRSPQVVPRPGSTMARRVAEIEADGVSRVTFTDIRTDLDVPVVCCVLQRPSLGRPMVTVGLSCKLDVATACDKALCEAISDHERLRTALDTPGEAWSPAPDFSNVVDFEWHGRVYTDPALQPALEFLLGDGEVVEVDGDFRPGRPEGLVETLQKVGPKVSDVIMVDLTTRDMHELGVSVVKVFVPELVPLNADHRYPYLGHERLHSAGGRRPGTTKAEFVAQLNPYPHPFS